MASPADAPVIAIPRAGGSPVSASVATPATPAERPTVIVAHGAGTDRTHPSLTQVQAALAGAGYTAVLFNFPYRERGRKLPDARPVLEACYRDVLAWVRDQLRPTWLAIGGRSMGGRMASYLAADAVAIDALLLLGYPLSPAGKPEQVRADHLPHVRVPALFVQGTRDALAPIDRLREAIAPMPHATLHTIAEGDHGFRVPRRTGRTEADVRTEIATAVVRWLDAQRQSARR